jgi:glucuronoarabinoxylan endo-1,4-beta-xylanase
MKVFTRSCLLLSLVLFQAQTYSTSSTVSGTVMSPAWPIQNASLTFVDNADTTIKFSTTSDSLGHYQVNLAPSSVPGSGNLPSGFQLAQNYPNPFSGSTAIPYQLAAESNVRVVIYDILGREVKSFNVGSQTPGTHIITWDGRNSVNKLVAPGVYFYRLQVKGETRVMKMVFGPGEKSVAIPSTNTTMTSTADSRHGAATPSQIASFTVRIANTGSTSPLIVAAQFDNVLIAGDTTLNFTVAEYVDPFTVTAYLDSTRQVIRGFGAANILAWRPDMKANEITRAFGKGPGQIGFSILRLRLPSTQAEFNQNLATAQQAKAMGVTLFASPWSPPASMKSNNSIVGGYLNDTSYASFAAWLKSFADFMSANGAPLSAVSVQNEPDVTVTYESCDWNATQLLRFARDFAPAVGTPIIIPESFHFDHTLSDSILNDPVAVNNVSIIGGHLYGGGLTSYPLAEQKGKEIWMTEWLDTDTTWAHTLAVGKQINDCMSVGMNAYVWWYIVRFYGPILEDGNVSRRGYVMSQYARFVRPGDFRIKTTGRAQAGVDITAYRNGSKVTFVLVNRNSTSAQQTLTVPDGTMNSFTPYVTSATRNCVQGSDISYSSGRMTVTLEASSVTTLVGN